MDTRLISRPLIAVLLVGYAAGLGLAGPTIDQVGPREPIGWDTAVAPLSAQDQALIATGIQAATPLTAATIRTAIAAAQQFSSNVVLLPDGEATINEQIDIPDNIIIFGATGVGECTLINVTRTSGTLFRCTGDNLRFSRLKLEGYSRDRDDNYLVRSERCLDGNGHFNTQIDHCEIAGFCYALNFTDGSGSVRTSNIHHNTAGGLGYGVCAVAGVHVQVLDNDLSNNRHSLASNGTLDWGSGASGGTYLHLPNDTLTYFEVAYNNIHDDIDAWPGICAVDSHSGMDGSFDIHHNLFDQLGLGIEFSDGTGTINNNYFKSCTEAISLGARHGMHNAYPVDGTMTHDVDIFNNTFVLVSRPYDFHVTERYPSLTQDWARNIFIDGVLDPDTANPDEWPNLQVNSNAIDFGPIDDAASDNSLILSNSQTVGSDDLNWIVTEDTAWLSVTPPGGTVDGTPQQAFTVSVDPQWLPHGGVNSATFRITNVDLPGDYEDIQVTLDYVGILPDLTVTTNTLDLGTITRTTTDSTTVGVQNAGGYHFDWGVTDEVSWLTVAPMSGTTATGPDALTITVDPSGVTGTAPYHYTGTFTVYRVSDGTDAEVMTVEFDCPPLSFPDPGLEAAIRDAIAKPTGDIFPHHVAHLTSLDASGRDIVDLTGLDNCEALTQVNLAGNQLSDLTVLGGMARLTYVRLDENQVSDLTPLAGLPNLRFLYLRANQVADVAPLAGLVALELLRLGDNLVTDISDLAGLTELKRLELGGNQVSDIGPVGGMVELRYLSLTGNQVADIGVLGGLTELNQVRLGHNQIADISALVANAGLAEGDKVNVEGNQLDLRSGSQASADVQALRDRGVIVYCDNQATPTRPAMPTDFAAALAGGRDVSLSWTDNADNEDGFTVQRRKCDSTDGWPATWTTVKRLAANLTAWSDTSLTEDGQYQYRVRAFNAVCPSDWSRPARIVVASTRPPIPSNFAAQLVDDNTARLTWTDNSDINDGFTLQRRQWATDTGWPAGWITVRWLGPNVETYDDTLTEDGIYQYRARAFNSIGPSNWTRPQPIIRATARPDAPSDLTLTAVPTGIRAEWTANATNARGYVLQNRKRNADETWPAFTTVKWLGATVESFTDTNLSGDGAYQYRVRAYNAVGPSAWAPYARIAYVAGAGMPGGICSVAVTQANGQFVNIVYGLSAAADITIEVRNIAGRLIRAIPCGSAAAGLNTATWNLRNTTGAPVPSGMYLCTVTARAADGGQTTAIRAMSVRR